MKKGQFALIIELIVLCAGGLFGYVKYRLDNNEHSEKEKNSSNNISENSNIVFNDGDYTIYFNKEDDLRYIFNS